MLPILAVIDSLRQIPPLGISMSGRIPMRSDIARQIHDATGVALKTV
jgi:hypothetical protein